MKPLTIEQSNELQKLARTIRDGGECAKRFVELANHNAEQGIAEGVQNGLALTRARAILGRKGLAGWLAKHCGDVTPQDAATYLRLDSNRHYGADLRKSYQCMGIPPTTTRPANYAHVRNLNQGSGL